MTATLEGGPPIAGIDKPVSRLALGTAHYDSARREHWFAVLDEFLALGGALIDSGRIYGDSEAVIGAWMAARGVRDRVIVVTKCGHGPDALLPDVDFEETVTQELAASLDALDTGCIDLYMLHRDNPAVAVGRIMDRLNAAMDAGRVRAIGASNWTYARVDEANAYAREHGLAGFAVVSNNLSLAVPAAPFYKGLVSTDAGGEAWHARTGVPLLSWSSQARGFFAGCCPRDRLASIEDPFTRRMVEVYGSDANFERLGRAQELGARKGGYSAVQVALAWLLHKPFAVVPIVGAHTVEEVRSCAEAAALELTPAECAWLNGSA